MFGILVFLTIFTQVVQQMLPDYVAQRTMYEARERPSKTYSWKAFMVSTILVEAVWNSVRMSPDSHKRNLLTVE